MRRVSGWEAEALSEWQGEMALYTQGELTAAAREKLRFLLERTLETEITERLGSTRYGRSAERCDWRNGHRRRDLVTELGLLRGLRVPRSRKGSYQPQVFGRYQRRTKLVNALIVEMFVAGVATRRVGEVLEALLGAGPSASTVSQIAKELDGQVQAFHHRKLEAWPFLVLDGVYMHVKGAAGLRKRVVLVALGQDAQGGRRLLDFRLAEGESEAEWTAFLESLRQRGLSGAHLKLVISDGAPGIKAAQQLVYPYARQQRCWVHKLRNVVGQVRRADQEAVAKGARAIYQAKHQRGARQAFQLWKRQWESLYPKAVARVEKDLDALLVFLDHPAALHKQLRTTNAIERCFVEVRRRTRPMSAFTNDASCERITYALITHMNNHWSPKPSSSSRKSTHKT
jgi:putative transposase